MYTHRVSRLCMDTRFDNKRISLCSEFVVVAALSKLQMQVFDILDCYVII